MIPVRNVDELKKAIDTELATKSTKMAAIFQREFPGSYLCDPDEPYSWDGGEDVFSNYDELLSKHLSLKLPNGSETLVVFEYGLCEEQVETFGLRYILLNCFLHSRIFEDEENPLFIRSPKELGGDWEGNPPPLAEAYERVVNDLIQLLNTSIALIAS